MSNSQMVLRGHKAQLLVVATVIGIACTPDTYDPHIQAVDLPPGVSPDPAQIRAQAGMRPSGPTHTYLRPGSKCSGCVVQVEIGPLGDTREVDPTAVAVPATGRAVARIVNHDPTYTEAMYGFRPSTQFEYIIWADTAGGTARMTLLEVPPVGQGGKVRATFQKNLQLCVGHPPPRISDADFKFCKGVHVSTGITATYAGMWGGMSLVAALLTRLNDVLADILAAEQPPPTWLGCTHGCCG
jgi:hypothetical protein